VSISVVSWIVFGFAEKKGPIHEITRTNTKLITRATDFEARFLRDGLAGMIFSPSTPNPQNQK